MTIMVTATSQDKPGVHTQSVAGGQTETSQNVGGGQRSGPAAAVQLVQQVLNQFLLF